MARRRGPLDLLADLLAELSDEELNRAYAEAAMNKQTLAEYAWQRWVSSRQARAAIRAVVDPDIETKEYRP